MSVKVDVGGEYKEAADLTPTGVISAFAGTTAPSGWLMCDGSAVSRSTYENLYTVIGDAFGEGDGSTTFNLPDFRGQFLRGRDAGEGKDPDAASRTAMASGGNTGDNVGSVQGEAVVNHTHTTNINHIHQLLCQNASAYSEDQPYLACGPHSSYRYTATSPMVSSGGSKTSGNPDGGLGGSETRPINAYVNYIIKH